MRKMTKNDRIVFADNFWMKWARAKILTSSPSCWDSSKYLWFNVLMLKSQGQSRDQVGSKQVKIHIIWCRGVLSPKKLNTNKYFRHFFAKKEVKCYPIWILRKDLESYHLAQGSAGPPVWSLLFGRQVGPLPPRARPHYRLNKITEITAFKAWKLY